jgi:2-C-methyl-D-erythritol 2,4-cyclodiphosphate synthase
MIRVGIGLDIHPLVESRKLVLGGVEIPFSRGLDGYSDADVLAHAIIDALLGAAGLGDIGTHFPSDEPKYHLVSSLFLLQQVRDLVQANGWQIGNIDATIIAEQPRIAPFIPQMRQRLGEALSIAPEQINLKATTAKKLGVLGAEGGIAAEAIALIEKASKR